MGVADYMTVTRSAAGWCASAVVGDRLVSVLFDEMPDADHASLMLLESAGCCVHCELPRCECCLACDRTWSDCVCES
jgi:hypothetical protein